MAHYAHLLAALCEAAGPDLQELDRAAAEVELDGRTLVIQPAHSADEDNSAQALEITVAVMHLDLPDPEDEAEALLTLHRLNALSLGVHGWRLGVDEDGLVLLRQRLVAERLNSEGLQALMADGVDRAASVQALLQEQLQPLASADPAPTPDPFLSSSFIKG